MIEKCTFGKLQRLKKPENVYNYFSYAEFDAKDVFQKASKCTDNVECMLQLLLQHC